MSKVGVSKPSVVKDVMDVILSLVIHASLH